MATSFVFLFQKTNLCVLGLRSSMVKAKHTVLMDNHELLPLSFIVNENIIISIISIIYLK